MLVEKKIRKTFDDAGFDNSICKIRPELRDRVVDIQMEWIVEDDLDAHEEGTNDIGDVKADSHRMQGRAREEGCRDDDDVHDDGSCKEGRDAGEGKNRCR